MRPGLKTLGFLLPAFVLASACAQVPVRAGTDDAGSAAFSLLQGDSIRSLDGQWRFHAGDDPHGADPLLNDSGWTLLRSDKPWTRQGVSTAGYAWYRFHLQGARAGTPLALMLPAIDDGYQLFADGVLVGSVRPTKAGEVARQTLPEIFDLPPTIQAEQRDLLLALRVWVDPFLLPAGAGPERGGAAIGDAGLLHKRLQASRDAQAMPLVGGFVGVCFDSLICLAMLAFVLLRKSERVYLWFAAALFCQAFLGGLTIADTVNRLPTLLVASVAECMITVALLTLLFFFAPLLRTRRGFLWKFCLVVALLPTLVTALWLWGKVPFLAPTVSEAFAIGCINLWLLFALLRRVLEGDSEARLLIAPILFLSGVHMVEPVLAVTWSLGLQHRLPTLANFGLRVGPFFLNVFALADLLFSSSLLVFLVRRFVLARAHEDRVATELQAARSVQQVLVPEVLPDTPGLAIGTAYHPAQEVGGDFFQILPLASGETLVVIGDVAGKGMPAALTVSLAVGTLRTLADYTNSPAEILAGLNRRLQDRGTGFTTCLVLRLGPAEAQDRRSLTLANAGHLAPFLNGRELPSEPSLPLGLDPDAVFIETTHPLEIADHLAVLTDGVPEAMHGRELFGFDRTAALSRASAAEIADAARGFGQADDITVLTVDLVPARTAAPAAKPLPTLQPA